MNKVYAVILLVLLLLPVALAAISYDQELSTDDKQQLEIILSPALKLLRAAQYLATFAAVVMLIYAGVLIVMFGSEMEKRKRGKQVIAGVIIGLLVIWGAPYFIRFLTP